MINDNCLAFAMSARAISSLAAHFCPKAKDKRLRWLWFDFAVLVGRAQLASIAASLAHCYKRQIGRRKSNDDEKGLFPLKWRPMPSESAAKLSARRHTNTTGPLCWPKRTPTGSCANQPEAINWTMRSSLCCFRENVSCRYMQTTSGRIDLFACIADLPGKMCAF